MTSPASRQPPTLGNEQPVGLRQVRFAETIEDVLELDAPFIHRESRLEAAPGTPSTPKRPRH